jgi:septal ring factor EnvC (AmiA/AmiB activator)
MRIIPAAFVMVFSLSLPAVLHADRDTEIRYKSRDLDKVNSELNRIKEEKERVRREAEALSRQMKEGQVKLKTVEQNLLYTRERTSTVSQKVAVTKIEHDKLLSATETAEQKLRRSFQRYYVASLLAGPSAPGPVYARQGLHTQAVRLNDLQSKQVAAHQNLTELVNTQSTLRSELQRQESSLNQMKTGLENKEKLLTKKMTQKDALEAESRELQKTSRELANLIDTLRTRAKQEKEEERRARVQKQASNASPISVHSLPWPVTGKIITTYGRHTDPQFGTPFVSNGIVIKSGEQKPVTAVAGGQVLYVGEFMSYGSMVVIEHPGDWYTVYGHLSKWNTEKGQTIESGAVVGWTRPLASGGTESYFELRFYGKPTDPMPWLQGR